MQFYHTAQCHRCRKFSGSVPVLAWPAYSPDMSPIEHVWDALDRRIRQRVPVPANIQQLHTAIEEEWPTSHRPQSTTWSTLCEGDVLHCVRQIVVTPDTDFGPPPNTVKLHILEWIFTVASLRHTLCNNRGWKNITYSSTWQRLSFLSSLPLQLYSMTSRFS